MKNKLFLIALAASFASTSCQDELMYSCDSEVDKWVKQNIEDIREMKSVELYNIENSSRQRAVFAAFSPNQKHSFWKSKLTDILSLDWSIEEQQHIEKLIGLIDENGAYWFTDRTGLTSSEKENIEDDITKQTYEWIEYAKNVLGWSQEQLYAITASPSKVIDRSGKIMYYESISVVTAVVATRSETPLCDCAQKSDWCSGNDVCGDKTCDYPGGENCGTLLLFKCDGLCQRRD